MKDDIYFQVSSGNIQSDLRMRDTNGLRYTVKGNPFVSRMRKSDCMFPEDTWK